MTWITWGCGTQETLVPSLKVDVCNLGVHVKLWQRGLSACHCYILVPTVLLLCEGTIGKILSLLYLKRKEIKVGYSENYKQTPMGLLMTISFLAFVLKPILSASLSVWPSISSVNHSEHEGTTSLKKTNTSRLDSELLEHVVLCGHSSHIRGYTFLLCGDTCLITDLQPQSFGFIYLYGYLCVWYIDQSSAYHGLLPVCSQITVLLFLFPSSMCNTQKPATQCFYLNSFLRSFR